MKAVIWWLSTIWTAEQRKKNRPFCFVTIVTTLRKLLYSGYQDTIFTSVFIYPLPYWSISNILRFTKIKPVSLRVKYKSYVLMTTNNLNSWTGRSKIKHFKNLSRGKQYTIFTSVTKQTRNQIREAYYWSEGKKCIFELLMNISLSSFADCRLSSEKKIYKIPRI